MALSPGFFCPLQALEMVVERTLFGTSPEPYHVVAIGFQSLSVVMVFLIARALTGHTSATIATLLFLLYQRSIEGVVWISAGFNEPPLTFLILAAIVLYLYIGRRSWWAVLILYLSALAIKQPAIVLPALVLLVDFHKRLVLGANFDPIDLPRIIRVVEWHLRRWWALWLISVVYGLAELLMLLLGHGHGSTGYGFVHPKEFLHYIIEYPALAAVPFLNHGWTIQAKHEVAMLIPLLALYGYWALQMDARLTGLVWFAVAAAPYAALAPYGPSDEYFLLPIVGVCITLAQQIVSLVSSQRQRFRVPRIAATTLIALVWIGSFAMTESNWMGAASSIRTAQAEMLRTVDAGHASQECFVVPQRLFNNALPGLVRLYRPLYRGTVHWRYGPTFAVVPQGDCVGP